MLSGEDFPSNQSIEGTLSHHPFIDGVSITSTIQRAWGTPLYGNPHMNGDTVDGRNPALPWIIETSINNEINHLSTGAGFLPSTLSWDIQPWSHHILAQHGQLVYEAWELNIRIYIRMMGDTARNPWGSMRTMHCGSDAGWRVESLSAAWATGERSWKVPLLDWSQRRWLENMIHGYWVISTL